MSPVIVAHRFELLELAGEGGMGDVYRARDLTSGAPIALKLMRERSRTSASARRFERESWALEELSHPGIVAHVAHGISEDGQPFLAMEWLDGKTLAARLGEGPLPARDALTIVARAAEAVAAAHARGMTHRDVKPSNLFLCDGRPDRVKVLDFGLVRRSDRSGTLTHNQMVGTPAYMAPEQARGRPVDPRADVFSFGCVLFECLTGRRPFDAETVAALLLQIILEPPPRLERIRPDLPLSLIALVERMLAKSPEERPADAAAVVAAIAHVEVPADSPGVASPVHDGGSAGIPPGHGEPALTAGERRFQCVVLAHHPRPYADDETMSLAHDVLELPISASSDATMTLPQGPVDRLELLRRTTDRYGAQLDRLLDGTLMAAFEGGGTPGDLAVGAARCALALREVAPALQMALVAGWGVAHGAASHAGELAERATGLLQDAREGSGSQDIRVNTLVAELLGARFEMDEIAGTRFLRGERGQGDGSRALLGQVSPFVGRAKEMATLTSLLAECCDDSVARAVLVTADAGMGKSRLRHELVAHARERGGMEIWIANGDPLSEGSAFAMLAQTIRQAAGILEGEPLESRRAKLSARVARELGDGDPTTAALLGELVGSPFPADEVPLLRALREDPAAMSDKMRAAFCRWFSAAVAARPVLIVLEDLHWGDLPTLRLLDEALGLLKDRPLMLLALARPEVHAQFPGLWARREVQEIRLAGLTRKASEALVHQVLGGVSGDVAAQIADRAQGNAFFLEELIRAVAKGHAEALPETVLAMLQRRIESQTPLARRVLRAASVFGRDFWDDGVAELIGGRRRSGEVRSELAALVEGELLSRLDESRFPGAGAYRFRHALLSDAAYTMLTPDDRALGHRLAAAWLERSGERDPLVLAGHRERGGELGEAAALYLKAAQGANRAGDFVAALKHVARAWECGPGGDVEGPLHYVTALASWPLGRFADTEQSAIAALKALPPRSADWHDTAMLALITFTYTRKPALFAETLEALLRELSGDHIGPAHLLSWSGVTHLLFRLGRAEDALHFTRCVEQRTAELGTPTSALHHVRHFRAFFWSHEPEVALLEARAAEQILKHVGDASTRDTLRTMAADAAVALGAFEESERSMRELDARLDDAPYLRANASMSLARALGPLGRLDEALALAHKAVEAMIAAKNPLREGLARGVLAETLAATGDLVAAKDEALRAMAKLAIAPPNRSAVLALLASLHLRLGEIAEALAAAREAHAMMETTGVVSDAEANVRLSYAEAQHAAGEHAAAREAIAEARDRLLVRADTITEDVYRRSFLTRVPANARTLALASAWLGSPAP